MGMGYLSRGCSDGWRMGGRQWSCSACTAPVVAPRKRRVGGEEQSRRPPWEEEMDEATSLGPQEFQALA